MTARSFRDIDFVAGLLGYRVAKTEPSPVSASLAVAKQGGASEGPERAGNKPLMRNPQAVPNSAAPIGHTASDTFKASEGPEPEELSGFYDRLDTGGLELQAPTFDPAIYED